MSNEITVRPENSIATPTTGYGIEGMEDMGQEDMILPRYSIVQPTSKGTGDTEPGWFWNNLAKEAVNAVFAVILRVNHTRTLWSGDLADKTPECSSYDGITGRTYGTCAGCQFNAWGGKEVKYCKQGYMFLCTDPSSGEKFMIGAMGTSVRPAKLLISQFMNKRRSPFSAVIKFLTAKVEGDKGKYWVLNPSIYKWLEPHEVTGFRDEYVAMARVNIKEVEIEEGAVPPPTLSEDDF